jgi:hypothetical protein
MLIARIPDLDEDTQAEAFADFLVFELKHGFGEIEGKLKLKLTLNPFMFMRGLKWKMVLCRW